jgi:hypothetical protein
VIKEYRKIQYLFIIETSETKKQHIDESCSAIGVQSERVNLTKHSNDELE